MIYAVPCATLLLVLVLIEPSICFKVPLKLRSRPMTRLLMADEIPSEGSEPQYARAGDGGDRVRVAKEGILGLAGGQASDYTVGQKHLLELQGYIRCLEESTAKIDEMEGSWELLYTNDDPTRSSPFFGAFRKSVKGIKTPVDPFNQLPADFGSAVFKITDNIPIKSVGLVKQCISTGEIKSEVRVIVNPMGSSLMTTTSNFSLSEEDEVRRIYNVRVIKTEVLDSTVAKFLPGLDPASNPNGFPSGAVLELVNPGSSTFQLCCGYNDGELRVVRSLEDPDSVFVYKRV